MASPIPASQRLRQPSHWLMAARPRTIGLSISPVVVGAALAWGVHRQVQWPVVLAALAGGICIQVGTNLHNDAADSERGGDGPDRIGPLRVTASGLISARRVKHAALGCFALATSIGAYLAAVGGWPIVLLGIASILSGWAYTGGRRPIAYTPLGEAFVVAFFGLGAVGGTYWLCSGAMDATAACAGLALGLIAGAVLLVNNHRDRQADGRVGRRTLAIVMGPWRTRVIYALMMLAPFALLLPIAYRLPEQPLALPAIAIVPAVMLIHRFSRETQGAAFNAILAGTVQVQLVFSLLLAAALLM